MAASDGQELFNERRRKCGPIIREALDYLIKVAETAGPDVKPPIYERNGNGPKYSNGSGQFCVLHPKPDLHVGAYLDHERTNRPALIAALNAAHLTFTREDTDGPWVRITNMQEAKRFESLIVRAYNERSARRRY